MVPSVFLPKCVQHAYERIGAKFLGNHMQFHAVRKNIKAIGVSSPNVISDTAVGSIRNQLPSKSVLQHISPDHIASQE